MSWAIGFDSNWQRDIGYGVPAYCDHPKCKVEIDRGLSYVCCGEEPYGGERGCGLYFCSKHMCDRCARCRAGKKPFKPKPEHPEWIKFKETDESWAEWRKERDAKRQPHALATSMVKRDLYLAQKAFCGGGARGAEMKRKRVALIKSGRRVIKMTVTGFDPKKAREHHKKHGDMHGKLCLLSECPIHYPKARRREAKGGV